MTNKNRNEPLEELITESMRINEIPPAALNRTLKASLYQHEAAQKQSAPVCSIALWYVPMILNFILFALFMVCALLLIANPYTAILVSGMCGYIALSGIIITFIGIKRTNMKENMRLHVQKRGALA